MKRYTICLSIAGSDPSGGAGIQADLKTFSALGCYGQAVIAALTAQNTEGVRSCYNLPPSFVGQQIEAIFEDCMPQSVKIGMLGDMQTVHKVAQLIDQFQPPFVVIDPVMISTSGMKLLSDEAIKIMRKELLPLADLVTPNLPELRLLAGEDGESQVCEMAKKLSAECGSVAVLAKGGHISSTVDDNRVVDYLYYKKQIHTYSEKRVFTANTHGTGCTLSSAIAAFVALGNTLPHAVHLAKTYLTKALEAGAECQGWKGAGPMNHFFQPRKQAIHDF